MTFLDRRLLTQRTIFFFEKTLASRLQERQHQLMNKKATILLHTGGSLEVAVIVKATRMIYEKHVKGTRATTTAAMVTVTGSSSSVVLEEEALA